MVEEKDIIIRLAKREDAFPVTSLLRRLGLNLPDSNEVEKINNHWNRLWNNNPFYNQFHQECFYGWIMEHNRVIVGFFGCIPRLYVLNSKIVPVAIASQWGVEKEYRTFTHLLCDKFFNDNPISLKLVTTAIKPTGRIFEKYGGYKIPIPEVETVYMVPINLFKLIAYKYEKSIIASVFHLFNNIVPWSLQFKLIKKNTNITEVSVDTIPNEIDLFFSNIQSKVSGLIALRKLEILKWFYTGGNRGLKKRIFIYRSKEKIIGYAAIMEEPIKDIAGLKRYKIIDLIADNSLIKKEIIRELISVSYSDKVDVLEIHHAVMIDRKDIPAFVLKRKLPQFPIFYQTTNLEWEELLKHKINWNLSPFDGDTCLD